MISKANLSPQKLMGWIMVISSGIITPIITYLLIENNVFEITDILFIGVGTFVFGWGISWIRKIPEVDARQ